MENATAPSTRDRTTGRHRVADARSHHDDDMEADAAGQLVVSLPRPCPHLTGPQAATGRQGTQSGSCIASRLGGNGWPRAGPAHSPASRRARLHVATRCGAAAASARGPRAAGPVRHRSWLRVRAPGRLESGCGSCCSRSRTADRPHPGRAGRDHRAEQASRADVAPLARDGARKLLRWHGRVERNSGTSRADDSTGRVIRCQVRSAACRDVHLPHARG